MLYPQSNQHRQSVELADFWNFRFDPEDAGLAAGWQSGFTSGRPIAVPASWNDQFEDGRDFLGPAWYQTRFGLPWGWKGKRIVLRFGSEAGELWWFGECSLPAVRAASFEHITPTAGEARLLAGGLDYS